MKFPPLASSSRSDAVARRLSDMIRLGLVDDGEQLPSEADLSAQLGVATVTLREALQTLRQEGLIETRRGRRGGSFVRLPRSPSLAGIRKRLRDLSAEGLRELGDYRIAVSGAAAGFAAERGSDFERNRLAQRAAELAAANDLTPALRADSRFHIEMSAIAHSIRLTRAEMAIQAEIGELLLLVLEKEADRDRAVEQHTAIADAVEARDAEAARRLAEAHVAADSAHLIDLYIEASGGGT